MIDRRRDRKGRVLRNGEGQDPDGRYRFSYYADGKQRSVYSWKLEKTDRVPQGKRDSPSLREKEQEIRKAQGQGIAYQGGGLTVHDLVQRYTDLRTGVRDSTRAGYQTVLNLLGKAPFGQRRIDTVKLSDAKGWLISLQANGRRYSPVHTIRGVLRPAFQMAVEDDLLLKNPFEFQLVSVLVNDSVTREAVSRKDERRFLDFLQSDSHFSRYYEGVYILFHTGLRISGSCGLTLDDIDMEDR